MNKMVRRITGSLLLLMWMVGANPIAAHAAQREPLALIVMDPLAAPLSCPCVEGYAQRKYEVLAEHLTESLARKVELTFGESLSMALKKSGGKADLLIGKDSVVRADAATAKIDLTAIAQLTDQQGSTQLHGLLVVNKHDPAKTVSDLKGYTIIFGPAEADEKHLAALQLFQHSGIAIPTDQRAVDLACSDGACKVIDLGPKSKTAAVISSYAQPLLEGCGTIKKGDLRVVGETDPVPFITLFAASSVSSDEQIEIASALDDVATKPELLDALESLVGFLPMNQEVAISKKK